MDVKVDKILGVNLISKKKKKKNKFSFVPTQILAVAQSQTKSIST